jgi:hypothetical protein
MDVELRQVLQRCSDPAALRYYMSSAEFGPKIRKLAQAGLVRVQM